MSKGSAQQYDNFGSNFRNTIKQISNPNFTVLADVFNACNAELWHSRKGINSATSFKVPIINNKPRISEQEARFIMAIFFDRQKVPFSVEYPTSEKYIQKGISPSSARVDLVVDPEQDQQINVEMKTGPVSLKAESKERIRKDIEKFVKEKYDGAWYHTLHTVQNNSITNLCEAYFTLLKDHIEKEMIQTNTSSFDYSVLFHVCVIKHGFSIQRMIRLHEIIDNSNAIDDFMNFEYTVSRNELLSIDFPPAWEVLRNDNAR